MNYVRFNPTTGAILQTGHMPEDALQQFADTLDWHWIEGVGDPNTQYVHDGMLAPRPALEFVNHSLAVGENVVFTLPVTPCVVTVDGTEYTVTDAVLHFDATTIGEYTLSFKAYPYYDKTITVTVHAA